MIDQQEIAAYQMDALVEIGAAAALVRDAALAALGAEGPISRTFLIFDVCERIRELVALSTKLHISNNPPTEAA